jgi:hypothetical protein
MDDIAFGLCQCGCGQRTTIATYTWPKWGHIKGQPKRFVRGHGTRRHYGSTPRDCGHDTPCHIYDGPLHKSGYGLGSKTNGVPVRAHRAAWIKANGPIPNGLHVLHACDIRACVNPEHLFLGTLLDNNADRDRKGRNASKLTAEQVAEIRARCAAGETQQSIADDHGVSRSLVSMIKDHRVWRDHG